MPKQTVYLVVKAYDAAPMQLYDNRAAAEQHAAYFNMYLRSDEDEPVFEVWEAAMLSEFQPAFLKVPS